MIKQFAKIKWKLLLIYELEKKLKRIKTYF